MNAVRAHGGFVGLIYIALNSPKVSWERMQKRVQLGGHGVPKEKLAARWQRSIEKLRWYARKPHVFLAYDNSYPAGEGYRPRPFASGGQGQITVHDPSAIPEITQVLQR